MSAGKRRASVATRAVLLDGRGRSVSAVLGYDAADPWAVSVAFRTGPRWVLARELLAAGLALPTGDGDVRVAPHPTGGVVLGLCTRDERAEVLLDGADVGRILARSYALVPLGAERVDWAAEEPVAAGVPEADDDPAGGAS
ncbi:MAG: SsgA family sporulation/cell division regulator [Pseudonocardiaceae bacterium]|nr:SsgA family sporulation/cell division regulator [Pseudonocardiaceae bacterium]